MRLKIFILFLIVYFFSVGKGYCSSIENTDHLSSKEFDSMRKILEEKIKEEGQVVIDLITFESNELEDFLIGTFVPIVKRYPNQLKFDVKYLSLNGWDGTLSCMQEDYDIFAGITDFVIKETFPDQYYDYLLLKKDINLLSSLPQILLELNINQNQFWEKATDIEWLKNNITSLQLKEQYPIPEGQIMEVLANGKHFDFTYGNCITNVKCFDYTECLAACTDEGVWSIADGLLDWDDWILPCLFDNPTNPSVCLTQLSCLQTCASRATADPYDETCCPPGSYCHSSKGIIPLGQLVPNPVTIGECVECPEVVHDDYFLFINYRGPVKYKNDNYIYPPNNYFRYKFEKQGPNGTEIISEDAPFYQPLYGNEAAVDIRNYSPALGDKFCARVIKANESYATCDPDQEVCINIACPEPSIQFDRATVYADMTQNGWPVEIEYSVTQNGNLIGSGTFAPFIFNNVSIFPTSWNAGDEFCMHWSVSNEYWEGVLGSCAEGTICTTVDVCDLPINWMSIQFQNIVYPSSATANDGQLTLEITGGSGEYAIIYVEDPGVNYSNTISNLGVGVHCFEVVDLQNIDNFGNGCSEAACIRFQPASCGGSQYFDNPEHRTNSPSNERLLEDCLEFALDTSPESSPNANDGSIKVFFAVFDEPGASYYYVWDDLIGAQTTNLRQNLAPGEYCVTVYKILENGTCCTGYGCTTVEDGCIGSPLQLSEVNIVEPEYCYAQNGSISIDEAGIVNGSPPFSFEWENGSTQNFIDNLAEGEYSVTVTDYFGCTVVGNYVLEGLRPFNITTTQTNPTFSNCNGSISISIPRFPIANPPFSITLSLNGEEIQTFSGNNIFYQFTSLCQGNYELYVEDSAGCTYSTEIDLFYCSVLYLPEPDITHPTSCQNSSGEALMDGAIDFGQSTPLNGTPPYTFEWSNGASTLSISDLVVGQYRLTVTDANGCSTEFSYMVNYENPNGLEFVLEVVELQHDLENNCTGFMAVHVQYAGASPYIYVDIAPGSYPPIVLERQNGIVDEVVYLPVSPPGLCEGAYTISAYTESGIPPSQVCSFEITESILSCPGFDLYDPPQIEHPSDCNASNGSIIYPETEHNPYGGTEPYTWIWSNGSTNPYSITDLEPGAYSLIVIDANGCSIEKSFELGSPNDPELTQVNILQQPINGCDGVAEISGVNGVYITIEYPNGQAEQFILGQGPNPVTNSTLCIGDYVVTATLPNGTCPTVIEFSLTGCEVITLGTMDITPPGSCNSSDGRIRFITQPSGGAGGFTYTLIDEDGASYPYNPLSGSFSNLPSSMYVLTVTDAIGCSEDFDINLLGGGDPEVIASFAEPECEDEYNGKLGLFVESGNGGNHSFNFELIPFPPNVEVHEDGNYVEYLGLETGNYEVVVTSDVGCSITVPFFVDERPSEGPFQFVGTPDLSTSCPFQGTGSLSIGISGGNPRYEVYLSNISDPGAPRNYYLIVNNPPGHVALFENLFPGPHILRVVDDCDREIIYPGNIIVPSYPAMNIELNQADECSTEVASTDLVINGPGEPVSYLWSTGATTQNLIDVQAGNYSVTVTDIHGCTESAQINLEVYQPLDFNLLIDWDICIYRSTVVGEGKLVIRFDEGVPDPVSGFQYSMTGPDGYDVSGETFNRELTFENISDDGDYTLTVIDKCDSYSETFPVINQTIYHQDISGPESSCFTEVECDGRQVGFQVGLADEIFEAPVANDRKWIEVYDNCDWELYCRNGGIARYEDVYQGVGTFGTGEEIVIYQGIYNVENPSNSLCDAVQFCKVEVDIVDPVYNYPIQGTVFKELQRQSVALDTDTHGGAPSGEGFLTCNWDTQDLFVVYCGDELIYQACIPECSADNQTLTEELEEEECRYKYECRTEHDNEDGSVYYTYETKHRYLTSTCYEATHSAEGRKWTKRKLCIADPYNPTLVEDNIGTTSNRPPDLELCCIKHNYNCLHVFTDDHAEDRMDSENIPTRSLVDEFATKVYPNPTSGELTVEYHATNDSEVSFKLLTLTGELVFSEQKELVKGRNIIQLDLDKGIARGVFLLNIAEGDIKSELHKIVKMD